MENSKREIESFLYLYPSAIKYYDSIMSIPLSEVHAIRYRSPHNPLKKSIFFKS